MQREKAEAVIVYAVVDDALSPDFPLGDTLEVFVRREDADRFIEEVRGDEPEMAAKLRIEERELDIGGFNRPSPFALPPHNNGDIAVEVTDSPEIIRIERAHRTQIEDASGAGDLLPSRPIPMLDQASNSTLRA